MYDRKTYLYFGLAIIGFLLWNAWQADYGPKTTVSTVAPSTAMSQAPLPSQEIPKANAGKEAEQQGRFIEVKTDTLNVKIDRVGGNIVSLTLPKYPTSYETQENPETILTDNPSTYYAASSAAVSQKGKDSSQVTFKATQNAYKLESGSDVLSVVLTGEAEGQEIKKTYTFKRGRYDVEVDHQVTNNTNAPWTGSMYAQIKRRGLPEEGGTFGLHTYRGAAVSSADKPYEKVTYKNMDKANLDRSIKDGWLAMQERYFVSAWVPKTSDTLRYYSNVAAIGPTDKALDKVYTIGFQTPEVTLAPKTSSHLKTTLYAGPEIADSLKQVAPHLDLVIDYGWLSIFSGPIFKVMEWIYSFVKNWGLAIILVTVLIKLLFYKLSETSYRSMARLRILQPKMLALKDRYGDDRTKLSQATMELYRKEKVNPLGGCLPMVIQIPVFIALYYVLIESVQLRQAPFIFWIHDLSVKDPYFILPILMGLSWMVQQKLSPPPADPVQAKMMMAFPVVFTLLFATFPAGLVLYWVVNNVLSILQQWHITRKVEAEGKKKPMTKAKGRVSSSR